MPIPPTNIQHFFVTNQIYCLHSANEKASGNVALRPWKPAKMLPGDLALPSLVVWPYVDRHLPPLPQHATISAACSPEKSWTHVKPIRFPAFEVETDFVGRLKIRDLCSSMCLSYLKGWLHEMTAMLLYLILLLGAPVAKSKPWNFQAMLALTEPSSKQNLSMQEASAVPQSPLASPCLNVMLRTFSAVNEDNASYGTLSSSTLPTCTVNTKPVSCSFFLHLLHSDPVSQLHCYQQQACRVLLCSA